VLVNFVTTTQLSAATARPLSSPALLPLHTSALRPGIMSLGKASAMVAEFHVASYFVEGSQYALKIASSGVATAQKTTLDQGPKAAASVSFATIKSQLFTTI
jgi:hypothetical protein